MTTERVSRKLVAILSADVKGYSRLMGEDEVQTVGTLKAYRQVMVALIERHRGRVVDSSGDNVLAEFASVVHAVDCAVEIQEELRTRNAELPENRRMEFRIGINLGDVIEDGERIYGDGLNIAARVQDLAEAGGICISGTVFDNVENKLDLEYESVGKKRFKNIAEPVRVYRVMMEPEAAGESIGKERTVLNWWQWATVPKHRRNSLRGTWEGTAYHFGGPDDHPIEISAVMSLRPGRKTVTGTVDIESRDLKVTLDLRGGFLSDRFFKMDYRNAHPDILQFGSLLFELSATGRELNGHFVGYGYKTQKVISGKVKMKKT